MQTISSGFIGDFKLGDNIVHNLATLRYLYALQEGSPVWQKRLLRKPIVILIASVAEAVLYDLYLRISHFTSEGVSNIPDQVLKEIRTKTIDEFAKYISNARSKALLGSDPRLYDDLDELRKLRNRVHIQNTKNDFEPDEAKAFSEVRQAMAQQTLEKLLKRLEAQYHRAANLKCVDDFVLPWTVSVAT